MRNIEIVKCIRSVSSKLCVLGHILKIIHGNVTGFLFIRPYFTYLFIVHKCPFFAHFPSHPNPLVQQIWICISADLTAMYKKYKNNRSSFWCK
jgi:hypothetical protein